jgi:hypothetical protein
MTPANGWGDGWSREGLVAAGVELAEMGFGIVRVYPPISPTRCSCQDGEACGRNNGKHPIGDEWQKQAERDPQRVRTMLGNPGNRSYGIIPPPGVFEWDVDKDAPEVLRSLAEKLGPLPPTRVHRSGNGKHVFYRWPASVPHVGGNVFGVTTRWAPGGMVVGPGSVHPTGRLYAVEDDRPIAEFPVAWAQAAAGWSSDLHTRQDAAAPGDPDWTIPVDHRHDFLKRSAARIRNVGLRGDALRDALLALNRDRCAGGGKPDAEIAELARYFDGKADQGPGVFLKTTPPAEVSASPVARIDAADLLALDLPPLRWIVPDILPEGTTILASPPKVGKSCFVYQVVAEVALGGELLGRRVASGSALYLALEDGKRRGQDRLRAALAGRTMPRGRLDVQWGSRRIGAGLEEELAGWLDAHADAAVVAIDTLGRVRPASSGRRNQYELDVEDLGRLQNLFRDLPISLLIVHHARKDNGGDDFLQAVSGTYGLTGSVDTIAALRRKRLETFGSLVVTGRDVPDAEFPVRFDGTLWHLAPASLPAASFERMEVYRVIEAEGPIFPKAIGDRLGLERSSVQHMVDKLVEGGAVARTTSGYASVGVPDLRAGNPDHSTHSSSDRSDRGDRSTRARATPIHTCRGCQQPIVDLAEGFFDGASSTFWHLPHWREQLAAGGAA